MGFKALLRFRQKIRVDSVVNSVWLSVPFILLGTHFFYTTHKETTSKLQYSLLR